MQNEFDKILGKVSELYRKYGIKSVTMDDVSHELGISKKTLYQYVADKSELVEKVVEYTRVCNFSSMHEIDEFSGNAIEQLIEVSQKVNTLMKDHSPAYEYDLKKYYPEIFNKLRSTPFVLMFSNTDQLGYNKTLTPDASIFDGKLDMVRVEKSHPLSLSIFMFFAFFNKFPSFSKISREQLKELRLQSSNQLKIQLDGERLELDTHTLDIKVLPKALEVIC